MGLLSELNVTDFVMYIHAKYEENDSFMEKIHDTFRALGESVDIVKMKMKGAEEVYRDGAKAAGENRNAELALTAAKKDHAKATDLLALAMRTHEARTESLTEKNEELKNSTLRLKGIADSMGNPLSGFSATEVTKVTNEVKSLAAEVIKLSSHTSDADMLRGIKPMAGSIQAAKVKMSGSELMDASGHVDKGYLGSVEQTQKAEILKQEAFRKTSAEAAKATDEVATSMKGWGAILKPGIEVLGGMTAAVALLGTHAAVMAGEFEEALHKAVTDSELLGQDGARNLKLYNDQILNMAGNGPYGAMQLAGALETVATAGYHGAAAMGVLAAAQEGAIGMGAQQLHTYTNALANLLDNFGFKPKLDMNIPISEQIAQTKEQAISSYGNLLNATVAGSRASVSDISQISAYDAPAAQDLGMSAQELLSTIGALSNSGGTPRHMGPELQMVLQNLMNPTQKASELLGAYGMRTGADAVSKSGGWGEYLATMSERITGSPTNKTFAGADEGVLTNIFGQHGVDVVRRMSQMSPEQDANGGYNSFLSNMLAKTSPSSTEGLVGKQAALNEGTVKAKWDDAIEGMHAQMIRLGEEFTGIAKFIVGGLIPALTLLLEGLTALVSFINFLADSLGSLVGLVGDLLGMLGSWKDSIGHLVMLIPVLGGVFDRLGVAANAAAGALSGFGDALRKPGDLAGQDWARLTGNDPNRKIVAKGDEFYRDLFYKDNLYSKGERQSFVPYKMNPGDLGGQTGLPDVAKNSLYELSHWFTLQQDNPKFYTPQRMGYDSAMGSSLRDSMERRLVSPLADPRNASIDDRGTLKIKGFDAGFASKLISEGDTNVSDRMREAMAPLLSRLEAGKGNREDDAVANLIGAKFPDLFKGVDFSKLVKQQNVLSQSGVGMGVGDLTNYNDYMQATHGNHPDAGQIKAFDFAAYGKLELNPLFHTRVAQEKALSAHEITTQAAPEDMLRNTMALISDTVTKSIVLDTYKDKSGVAQSNTAGIEHNEAADQLLMAYENYAVQHWTKFYDAQIGHIRAIGGSASEARNAQIRMYDEQIKALSLHAYRSGRPVDPVALAALTDRGRAAGRQYESDKLGRAIAEDQIRVSNTFGKTFDQQSRDVSRLTRDTFAQIKIDPKYASNEDRAVAYHQAQLAGDQQQRTIAVNAAQSQATAAATVLQHAQDMGAGVAEIRKDNEANRSSQLELLSKQHLGADANLVAAKGINAAADKLNKSLDVRGAAYDVGGTQNVVAASKLFSGNFGDQLSAIGAAHQANLRQIAIADKKDKTQLAIDTAKENISYAGQVKGVNVAQAGATEQAAQNAMARQQFMGTNAAIVSKQADAVYNAAVAAAKKSGDMGQVYINAVASAALTRDTTKASARAQDATAGAAFYQALQQQQAATGATPQAQLATALKGIGQQQVALDNTRGISEADRRARQATIDAARASTTNQFGQAALGENVAVAKNQLEAARSTGASVIQQKASFESYIAAQRVLIAENKALDPKARAAANIALSTEQRTGETGYAVQAAQDNAESAKNAMEAARQHGASISDQRRDMRVYMDAQRAAIESNTSLTARQRQNQLDAAAIQMQAGLNQFNIQAAQQNQDAAQAMLQAAKANGASVEVQRAAFERYIAAQRATIEADRSLNPQQRATRLAALATSRTEGETQYRQQYMQQTTDAAKNLSDAAASNGASVERQRQLYDLWIAAQERQIEANRGLTAAQKSAQVGALSVAQGGKDTQYIVQALNENTAMAKAQLDAIKASGGSVQQQREEAAQYYQDQRQAIMANRSLDARTRGADLIALLQQQFTEQNALNMQAASENVAASRVQVDAAKQFGASAAAQRALSDRNFNQQRAQILGNTSLDSSTRASDLAALFVSRVQADQAITNQETASNAEAASINLEAAKIMGRSVADQRAANAALIAAQRVALVDDRSLSTVDRKNRLAALDNTNFSNDQASANQAASDNVVAAQIFSDAVKMQGGNAAQNLAALRSLTASQLAQVSLNRGLTPQQATNTRIQIEQNAANQAAQIQLGAAQGQQQAAQIIYDASRSLGMSFGDQARMASVSATATLAAIRANISLSPQERANQMMTASVNALLAQNEVRKAQDQIAITTQQTLIEILKANSAVLSAQADATVLLTNAQRQAVLDDRGLNAQQKTAQVGALDASAYSTLWNLLEQAYQQQIGVADQQMQAARSMGASAADQRAAMQHLAGLQMAEAARRNDPTAYNQALLSEVQNLQGVIGESGGRSAQAFTDFAGLAKATGGTPVQVEALQIMALHVQYETTMQQLAAARSMLSAGRMQESNANAAKIASDVATLAARMQTDAGRQQLAAATLQAQAAKLLADSTHPVGARQTVSTRIAPVAATPGRGTTEAVQKVQGGLAVSLPRDQLVLFSDGSSVFHDSVATFKNLIIGYMAQGFKDLGNAATAHGKAATAQVAASSVGTKAADTQRGAADKQLEAAIAHERMSGAISSAAGVMASAADMHLRSSTILGTVTGNISNAAATLGAAATSFSATGVAISERLAASSPAQPTAPATGPQTGPQTGARTGLFASERYQPTPYGQHIEAARQGVPAPQSSGGATVAHIAGNSYSVTYEGRTRYADSPLAAQQLADQMRQRQAASQGGMPSGNYVAPVRPAGSPYGQGVVYRPGQQPLYSGGGQGIDPSTGLPYGYGQPVAPARHAYNPTAPPSIAFTSPQQQSDALQKNSLLAQSAPDPATAARYNKAAESDAARIIPALYDRLKTTGTISQGDMASLTQAIGVRNAGITSRTETAQNEQSQANYRMSLAQQMAPSWDAINAQTAATKDLVKGYNDQIAVTKDLSGAIKQSRDQALFANRQRVAQYGAKDFTSTLEIEKDLHSSVGTMAKTINDEFAFNIAHAAELGLSQKDIFLKRFQEQQSLLNQQFNTAPINFGASQQSQGVAGAGFGQTVASFGMTDRSETSREIANNTRRSGDLALQTVTTLASILGTLQSEQFSVQRQGDMKIISMTPASMSPQKFGLSGGAAGQ